MFKGIDISVWQEPSKIDYDKLAKEVDFVILRAGYTGYGKTPPNSNNFGKDRHFDTHYNEFKKRNVPIGAYWYGGAINKSEVDKEIAVLMDVIKGKTFEYPIYYDVEENRNHGTLSKAALTEIVKDWCAKVEAKGYYVGIYASLSWTRNKFDMGKLPFDLWLAHWGVSKAGRDCGVWQYTSDGKLNGYAGRLDMNIAYKDYPAIMKEKGLNGFNKDSKPEPTPTPKPTPKPTQKPSGEFKIGDEVIVNGTLYGTSNGDKPGKVVKNVKTKITRYNKGAKKPYNTTGDLGWVGVDQLTRVGGKAPDKPVTAPSATLKVGDKVKLINNVQYTGGRFTAYFNEYDVFEVKGDRVVIGKVQNGQRVVTAAVNIINLKKV